MLYNCNISWNVWLLTYLKYILLIKWFSVYLRICCSWNEVLIGRIRELNLSIRYMLVCIWCLFTSRTNFLLIMLLFLIKLLAWSFGQDCLQNYHVPHAWWKTICENNVYNLSVAIFKGNVCLLLLDLPQWYMF